jgi:pyruvyl transferase EpsO
MEIERTLVPMLRGKSSHICIIDPPGHPNVGDSAILLGELDFISRHFPQARLSFYDVESYSPAADRYIEQATVLLIHGGGNFGDIWPHHHRLRMRVIERFAHKATIQMPQSIHFDSRDELAATAAAIKAHSDLTLLVRDKRSFDLAQSSFECAIRLVPDMAFAMRPIVRHPPDVDYFCLLRTDKEAAVDHVSILDALHRHGGTTESRDWLDEPQTLAARLDRRLGWRTKANPASTASLRPVMTRLRRHHALQRLRYGVKLLSRGRTVVTDRLHAHILSCLLHIPNLTFDSYDGKISAFYETWTHEHPASKLVASPADLIATHAALAASPRGGR